MTLERTPILYEKIAHEGNDHKHDIVKYDISNPAAIKAACTRKVISKGKLKVEETRQLQADGAAIDMLSSFYYMRNLPFQDWNAGETHSIDIFSGKAKELLTFKYVGKERIKINDREYDTYHITFLFTSKGGTKSSDDMDAWISAEGQRIPLRLEGKLPVGRVKCFFVDENK